MSSFACVSGSPSIMRTGGRAGGSSMAVTVTFGATAAASRPSAARSSDLDRLLLGRHDPLEAGVARLVEPLLGRDERGQRGLPGLAPAVDLPLDRGLAVADLDLHRHRHLRQVEQLGQHARDLAVVAADALLPAQDEVERARGS